MDQLTQLSNELYALVCRYRHEADLTFAEVIGAIPMKACVLMAEATDRTEELQ